jgi:hypothetical protein
MPYVAATIDQQFRFSSNLNIPNQAALPDGDVAYLQEAQTFYGGQLGLDVRGPNGWTFGVKAFVLASADTNRVGGDVYVKIPLGIPPAPAPALVAKY